MLFASSAFEFAVCKNPYCCKYDYQLKWIRHHVAVWSNGMTRFGCERSWGQFPEKPFSCFRFVQRHNYSRIVAATGLASQREFVLDRKIG